MSRETIKMGFAGLVIVSALLLAACTGSPVPAQPTPTSTTPTAAGTPAPEPMPTLESPLTPPAAATAIAQATALATLTPPPTVAFPVTPQALVVQWEKNDKLGDILTDPQGRTVYTYKNDTAGQSTCTADCAKTWPPVTIAAGIQPWGGPRVPGTLGVISRADGSHQVTYNGQPLYLYSGDKNAGDGNGQGIDNLWSVVSITPATTETPTPRP